MNQTLPSRCGHCNGSLHRPANPASRCASEHVQGDEAWEIAYAVLDMLGDRKGVLDLGGCDEETQDDIHDCLAGTIRAILNRGS